MSKDTASPPSYEDTFTRTPLSRGQNILDQLTLVRAQQIRSVISQHIIPLIEQQALYGIAQTIIAMIPSDTNLPAEAPPKSEFSFDNSDAGKQVEVIGFASDEQPQIIRLQGHMNRTEFWRPEVIIQELERVLGDELNASPNLQRPQPPSENLMQVERKPVKKSFFGRVSEAMNQEGENRYFSGPPTAEKKRMEGPGKVLAKARLEEICLRTVNEFGLYDTMTKQCIIIRVDARC